MLALVLILSVVIVIIIVVIYLYKKKQSARSVIYQPSQRIIYTSPTPTYTSPTPTYTSPSTTSTPATSSSTTTTYPDTTPTVTREPEVTTPATTEPEPEPEPEPIVYTYTQFPGFDSPGYDITPGFTYLIGNPAGLKSKCNNDSTCVGFNTDGWLKYKIKPIGEWNIRSDMTGNLGLYIKNPTEIPDYVFFSGLDSPGNDMGRKLTSFVGNISKLKSACTAIPQCVGFNTDGWLKSAIKSRQDWNQRSDMTGNKGLYIKSTTTMQPGSSVTANLSGMIRSSIPDIGAMLQNI